MHRGLRTAAVAAALAAAGLAVGACADDGARLAYEPVALPVAPGAEPRVAAVAHGADGWWAAGSVTTPAGRQPALWRSSDAVTWTPVPTEPLSYYGERSELYSVAASAAGVVAIGAASGGAHGNPRTATWVLDGDVLKEVAAPFERNGGPRAISVRAVTASPRGFVIVGTRRAANERTGAVAWVSADGREFTLVDDDPNLSSAAGELVRPLAVSAGSDGYVAVGDRRPIGQGTQSTDGIVWRSADGRRWDRDALGPDDLHRTGSTSVQAAADGAVAGVVKDGEDASVVVWRAGRDGGWSAQTVGGWGDEPRVTTMAADGGRTIVAGTAAGVPVVAVASGDGWRVAPGPDGAPAGPNVAVGLAAAGAVAVVAVAGPDAAGVWRAPLTD